mmetsp:Transcript_10316/g.29122  ORF Transcript_10316/g.29122 Transcript_10316/m.29122 type:complete len:84 (+) Transcript_10316:50-301(+)
MSRCDEASTMFLTWKRFTALSFGTQREQFEQRMMAVCPRPCLERPLLRRFDGIFESGNQHAAPGQLEQNLLDPAPGQLEQTWP